MILPYDTLIPYKQLPEDPIQYGVCKDFSHISRYRNLRQVVHSTETRSQFVSLETPNPFKANVIKCYVHEVTLHETNRLDIIAKNRLGSASYSWVIAYLNDIEDGFSCSEGQKLYIPDNITALMANKEFLESIPPMRLNLGHE